MKNIIVVLICITVLSVSGYLLYDKYFLLCDHPLSYSIGTFDESFNITQQKFLETIKEAEAVWESSAQENLFNYDPKASFTINLLYDERQQLTDEANVSEMNIEGTRATYDFLYGQYKSLRSAYLAKVVQYQADVAEYEQRLDAYNRKVSQINARGGARPNEARELENEKAYLESEINRLEGERDEINRLVEELNVLGVQVSALANKFNIQVDIHNEQFGQSRQFDQGDYRGDRINIYQFETINDLRVVLAHELGHALGLDHVPNRKSTMYYLMGEQNIVSPKLSSEDLFALRAACRF